MPLCIGLRDPKTAVPVRSTISLGSPPPPPAQPASPLSDRNFDWRARHVDPRWLGWETSDCAAALAPGIHSTAELNRFFEGAKRRDEPALVVAMLGRGDVDTVRNGPPTDMLPTVNLTDVVSVRGRLLGNGAQPRLAPGLGHADHDLGTRLKDDRRGARWWSLALGSGPAQWARRGTSPAPPPQGDLVPLLLGPLDETVVGVWVAPDGSQRWYIVPYGTDWNMLLDWLIGHALPEFVIGALHRARSPLHVHPALQTPAELAAQKALDQMSARHAAEKTSRQAALTQARTAAEGIRGGLLDGTGAELEAAVGKVLADAGFTVVDLDRYLGGTLSADLLVTRGPERRLVEVKSTSGAAPQSLAGKLTTHLQKWPALRPNEPVGGGVLIVNHEHGKLPAQRSPKVYTDQAFVGTLRFPVLAARDLFDWWRAGNWTAIQQAVLA
ncbi:hypothetical protein FraEuI1c_0858 [Pseudofrankia inefficax]|uniref:Uncharacterized protein n=2 Tax=Pseudofrankia inefficax (strain DSM 45817 / CECT 9037 / DDB 130130 / EuI1c) TaxID=298654 RepID=E3IW94_PSEI1|nr:hypothetical protein FraEuI1c_0858 [Pseudofrankia inefficax]